MAQRGHITPLSDDQMSEEQLDITKHYRRNGHLPNIFRIVLRTMRLFKAYKPFALHTMALSSVDNRIREIAILRIAHRNKCEYEWLHHARVAVREAGMSEAEVEKVKDGAAAPGWTQLEAAVLTLVDDLSDNANIDDTTYSFLTETLSEAEFADLMLTISNYEGMTRFLNVYSVPIEPFFEEYHAPV